jgi:hypothetical protein
MRVSTCWLLAPGDFCSHHLSPDGTAIRLYIGNFHRAGAETPSVEFVPVLRARCGGFATIAAW